jgi:hypothetical protein
MGKTTPTKIKDFSEIKEMANDKGNLRIYYKDDYIILCENQQGKMVKSWQEVMKIKVSTNSPDFITGMLSQFGFDIEINKPVVLTSVETTALRYAASCGADMIGRTPSGMLVAASSTQRSIQGGLPGFQLLCDGFDFIKSGEQMPIDELLKQK